MDLVKIGKYTADARMSAVFLFLFQQAGLFAVFFHGFCLFFLLIKH